MTTTQYTVARHNMVESQIRTNKVRYPALLEALEAIPREDFLPKSMRGIAYIDKELTISKNRYIMEPMVFSRLVELAQIQPDNVVLDIGATTGYGIAVLAHLSSTVIGVEEESELADKGSAVLEKKGVDNAIISTRPLIDGYPDQAPYDVILFEGAVEFIPQTMFDQLAIGGRLLAVLKDDQGVGRATSFVKTDTGFIEKRHFDAFVSTLPGFKKKLEFLL